MAKASPRRSLAVVLLGAVLFAHGPPLAGQDARARFSRHLGAVYAARTLSVIEAGVRDGLPRGLLIDKAMEGVAKGMAPEVVLAAVDTFAAELRDAASVVGPQAEPVALEKAADALRRGVGRELLTRLGRDRADFPLLVVSLEELLDAGVELGLAEDLVRYAVAEEFDSDAVLRLPASVKLLIRECGNGQPESCWSQASVRECARVMPTRPCPTRTLAEAARSAAQQFLLALSPPPVIRSAAG
ncbi:MAG: hypothetical protein F4Z72_13100 [Gemmatimonadales bacterium]|uniref:hypothetical protein n=1 Tax=Candidatus Palauibacter irciniicola TaxID=3056733 RepID=UPI00137DB27E|nr:hypothetical protein [Candidatus Palauibacter irciniicola]MYC19187.1 hypothetical protein [Gemmatimonadales bacterium]